MARSSDSSATSRASVSVFSVSRLRLQGERRVAAREDQPQSIVRDGHRIILGGCQVDGGQLLFHGGLPPQLLDLRDRQLTPSKPVDRPIASRRGDPRAGVVRDAALGPGLEGADERVLDGLLGQVEVARHPDERRDRPALLLAEQAIDDLVGGL